MQSWNLFSFTHKGTWENYLQSKLQILTHIIQPIPSGPQINWGISCLNNACHLCHNACLIWIFAFILIVLRFQGMVQSCWRSMKATSIQQRFIRHIKRLLTQCSAFDAIQHFYFSLCFKISAQNVYLILHTKKFSNETAKTFFFFLKNR